MAAVPTSTQRLAFGRVAELYDAVRPSYPAAAIDAVIEYGGLQPPVRILEVGAGTGKATALFAARGFHVTALEPSAEMAAVTRINCASYEGVEVVEAEFEQWRPPQLVPAIVCAGAWHWIAPDARYRLAADALAPGAALAAMWTFPDWTGCSMRSALSSAYRAAAPAFDPAFPMHPDSDPVRLAGGWHEEVNDSGLFTDPGADTYHWRTTYTSAQYALLLQTHQDHILLGDTTRHRLLAAVERTIDEAGGTLTMPYATRVCLARRSLLAG